MTELDDLTVKLLTLLDEYECLANGEYRELFVEGYMALSRANFSAHRVYGVDSYDMSEHKAGIEIRHQGEFTVVDRVKAAREAREREKKEEKKEKEKEKEKEEKPKKEEKLKINTTQEKGTSKTKRKQVEGASLSTSVATGAQEVSSKTGGTKVMEPAVKDPINQFGGLVPYHLKTAQTTFSRSISNAVALVNMQRKIGAIVEKLEQLETEEKADKHTNQLEVKTSQLGVKTSQLEAS